MKGGGISGEISIRRTKCSSPFGENPELSINLSSPSIKLNLVFLKRQLTTGEASRLRGIRPIFVGYVFLVFGSYA